MRDTKFGTHVSNKILLKAPKCQGYSFYRFWVINGKPTGSVKLPPPPTHIRVKKELKFFFSFIDLGLHFDLCETESYSTFVAKVEFFNG